MSEKDQIIKPLGFLNRKGSRLGNSKEATHFHATEKYDDGLEIRARCVKLACEMLAEDILVKEYMKVKK
ncbi:MAG: hypothetical protein ABSG57_04965 [Candidatus Bathyarchaeia archaeon]